MKHRLILIPTVVALVAMPMFIGFAGRDAAANRWDRIGRSGNRLVQRLFSIPTASADDDNGPYSSYSQALKVLKDEYYGEPITSKKTQDLTYEAIRGMLFSLNDPFTSFLNRQQWDNMQQTTRGDFDGVGAELEQIGPDIIVKRPIPDTPAFRIGLKARDQILSIGEFRGSLCVREHSTRGMDIEDAVRLIQGSRGTLVSLTVLRKGVPKPITFKIVRAHIEPPIVQ